jgi:hypothetical protein
VIAPTSAPALPLPARRELYARLVRREVERLAEAAGGRAAERADRQHTPQEDTPPRATADGQ